MAAARVDPTAAAAAAALPAGAPNVGVVPQQPRQPSQPLPRSAQPPAAPLSQSMQPPLPAQPPSVARPPTITRPPTVVQPAAVVPPTAAVPSTAVFPPTAIVPPTVAGQPIATARPPTVIQPPLIAQPPTVGQPLTLVRPPTVVQPTAISQPPTRIAPPPLSASRPRATPQPLATQPPPLVRVPAPPRFTQPPVAVPPAVVVERAAVPVPPPIAQPAGITQPPRLAPTPRPTQLLVAPPVVQPRPLAPPPPPLVPLAQPQQPPPLQSPQRPASLASRLEDAQLALPGATAAVVAPLPQPPPSPFIPTTPVRGRVVAARGRSGSRASTRSGWQSTTGVEYKELEWTPIVVGREEPSLFAEGLSDNRGWLSEPDAQYPIDVVLALDHLCDIHKLRIGGVDHLIPRKVEIRTGRPQQEDADPTHHSARRADFRRAATARFGERSPADSAPDIRAIFVDAECQYVWLLLHAPYRHVENRANQIRITELTIEGYEIAPPRRRRLAIAPSSARRSATADSRVSATSRSTRSSTPRSRSRRVDRLLTPMSVVSSAASSRPASIGASSGVSTFYSKSRLFQDVRQSSGADRDDDRQTISRGTLISRNDQPLAITSPTDDPIASARLVRSLLVQRRRRAKRAGRDIKADVCGRMIEQLDAALVDMRPVATRIQQATARGDRDEARRLADELDDRRDTIFRVLQLDLLLDDVELRELGIDMNTRGRRRRNRQNRDSRSAATRSNF